MGEEQSMPIDGAVEQAEWPVDYVNAEQLGPESAPGAQEIIEPVSSGSTVDEGIDVQINSDVSVPAVTISAEPPSDESPITAPAPAETQTDTKITEDTMPESTNAPTDIAAKVATIQARTASFEGDFNTEQAVQEDLLKQILDLMVERTRLLTALRDSLESVNERLAVFNAAKVNL